MDEPKDKKRPNPIAAVIDEAGEIEIRTREDQRLALLGLGPFRKWLRRISGGGAYDPLPFSYWITCLILVSILLGYSAVVSMEFSQRAERKVLHFGSSDGRALETGGAFATFYRSGDFEVPFRAGVLEMPFSYRTTHELQPGFPDPPVSGRFAARLMVPTAGTYRFLVDANDGARIWINNVLIFDKWETTSIRDPAGELALPRGAVPLYAEWHNRAGYGWLGIWWQGPDVSLQQIQPEFLAPDPGVRPPG